VKRAPGLAPRILFELVFASVTLYAARPAFASLHLPLQDLPQHMAAISVLKRYAFDPTLREYFELTLSRTQYLLAYLLGVILSIPFGVVYATRLLVALAIVSTPFALRFLVRRTGGDERWAVLSWPFLWNPQTMFGFLNFLLGIPITLFALGLFADREKRTGKIRQIQLALLTLAAFYSHLVPYGLLGLGVLFSLDSGEAFEPAMSAWKASVHWTIGLRAAAFASFSGLKRQSKRWVHELAFLVPSLLAAVAWILRSPARDPAVRAGGVSKEVVLTWPDRLRLPELFRETILDIGGSADAEAKIGWGLCLLVIVALSRDSAPSSADDVRQSAERPPPKFLGHMAWLPLACALLYVFTPEAYGWIWPIHTRFAVVAVLVLPLAFGRTRHRMMMPWLVVLCMATCAVGLTQDLVVNFQRWDEEELSDLDTALAYTRPNRRLVALVPPTRSAWVPSDAPLVHTAAYYQVHGGAVATFSFADLPQSPFRYRDDGPRPPRLRKGWEWEPLLREADPNHAYYDYVLVAKSVRPQSLESLYAVDEPARFPDVYARIYAGARWNLYERRLEHTEGESARVERSQRTDVMPKGLAAGVDGAPFAADEGNSRSSGCGPTSMFTSK
jgi:hypothetical protein